MYIYRDITQQLLENPAMAQILLGPRQCGKSTLYASFARGKEISFDDLQLRQLANRDPKLFLTQFETPLLLDEVQYVPNLFPEIKRKIDELKKENTFKKTKSQKTEALFYLTGSNQILMDKNIKESLAGRASYYYLNTLTVHEILSALPKAKMADILFKGGWPELYTNDILSSVRYLNDYVRSFVEKDIVLSAGIQKLSAFHTVLGLLAARTGQLIDYTNIANDSGISSVTIKEWVSYLERADLVYLLKPFYNNLNQRLIKTPKLYFLDTGLAARLQGWSDPLTLFTSPQIGHLFETLVFAEIIKFIRNYGKDWQLFFWRTKEGEEIDFIIKTTDGRIYALEVKLSLNNLATAFSYPPAFHKAFSPKNPLVIITAGEQNLKLSSQCITVSIAKLHDFLKEI